MAAVKPLFKSLIAKWHWQNERNEFFMFGSDNCNTIMIIIVLCLLFFCVGNGNGNSNGGLFCANNNGGCNGNNF